MMLVRQLSKTVQLQWVWARLLNLSGSVFIVLLKVGLTCLFNVTAKAGTAGHHNISNIQQEQQQQQWR
jgi:hypothetical protein